VTSTGATPTPATPSTTPATVVPVVPAQVPVPTTRVAAKTVAPQGLVAPPTTKKQTANAGGSGSSSGGGSAYYKNCTEVKKAGKAPILRGQPGYASHLDRDNDGIGCEK